MLLAVVSHEDDVPVGGPDEPCQPEGVVGTWRGRLDGGHLVGFDAAELRRGVQHADAPQERGVHLQRHPQVTHPARGLLGRVTTCNAHPDLLLNLDTPAIPGTSGCLKPGLIKISLELGQATPLNGRGAERLGNAPDGLDGG